ncbi:tyrosine-type recombinase/integrase [Psychrobacter sp. I-STPA6b]|uniref:tyrosine-type recombinase/integrase n=1 Tax=Psychrobacter sp. I-STPA6b TaxID=2585718 RepID=UPI001D0C69E4|nr:integrase arm-type DNA-binding domain-containing protein [Psychrobacter sp. I-STPA6b]
MAKVSKGITTVTQIDRVIKQTIKAGKQAIYPLAGYKGLELRIRPKGDKDATADFRHRYTHPYTGKRPYMTLGLYPAFTLEQARQAHTNNMRLLAQNIDPITHRDKQHTEQATAITHTFKAVAKDWLAEQTSNPEHTPSQKTIDNWQGFLEPLNNAFGNYPISEVTTQQVLAVCREIQKTHVHKGNRVKGLASRIFAHAVANGLVEVNPVLQLTGAKVLKPTKTNHHPALTTPAEFAELLKEIDQLNQPNSYNKEVLQLLALTFARIGDVCSMRWCDIDWQAKQWVFEPMKGQGREDMVDCLVIPLAPQTIDILQHMQAITGGHDYVFYNARRKKAHYLDPTRINATLNNPDMNKAGIGKDYCGQGYKDVHSPHGFRASAKTLLMERLGYNHLLTELQSGRQVPDQYGNTYNRMEAIAKRTEMMSKWANYLDDLKAGKIDNVIHTSFKQAEKKQG